MDQSHDFTASGYEALLRRFIEIGYEMRDFETVQHDERHLILRHDIDLSLEATLPLARIERSLGLTATYFVLLRTEMYNPFSARAQSVLQELRELGHDIGLHLDASLYPDDRDALDDAAAKECLVLEALLGNPVRAISFHRPAPVLVGSEHKIAGRISAYSRCYTTDMAYCSDSRGGWHHGSPLAHADVKRGKALQLLTHPIWWTAAPRVPATEKLRDFLDARLAFLDRELAAQCSIHIPAENVKGTA